MKYKAFLTQSGGCDYTIACGQKVINIEANNILEAKEKLIEIIEENYTGEMELSKCEIFEINEVVVCNLHDIYKRIEDAKYREEQSAKDKKEYEEFLRLKNKFEKA